MSTINPSEVGDLIACDVCCFEIPVSEAKSEEATEYVIYYFGLDCYDKWKKQSNSRYNTDKLR